MKGTLRTTGVSNRSPGGTKKAVADDTIFGYSAPPEVGLPRDVYKFIQRLALTCTIQHPRRDLSNGFYVAELLSRFYGSDIQMHNYQNGTSERCKRDNWELIQRVCQRHDLQIATKLVEGTIQGEPGAAVSLLEYLYEKFTGKKVQRMDLKEMQGLNEAAAAAAATAMASLPEVSFGEPAAASEGGVMRAIKSSNGAATSLEFGTVHTQLAGDAAALRKRFTDRAGIDVTH